MDKKWIKSIKLEQKILAIILLSGILVAVGYGESNYLSHKLVSMNKEVSTTIDTQNQINEMKILYYAAFMPNAAPQNTEQLASELLIKLEHINEKYQGVYLESADQPLAQLNGALDVLNEGLKSKVLIQNSNDKSLIASLDQVQDYNAQIKQLIIKEIRGVNREIQYSTWLILVALATGILGLLSVIYLDFLKPIREFSESIHQKTALTTKVHSDIQLTGINALSELADSYNRFVDKMNILNQLNDHIFAQNGFEEILLFIFNECKSFIPYNRIGVAVMTEDSKRIRALRAKSDLPILLGHGYQASLSETSLSEVIASNEYRIINDLEAYLEEHPNSESTKLIVAEGMRSSITIPLAVDSKVVGVLFFSSTEKEVYDIQHIHFLSSIANALTYAFEKSFVHDELVLAAIKGFAAIVESKDHVTGNHIDRMSYYSKYLAELLYAEKKYETLVDERFIEQVFKFSALHDIGKVGIDDQILNKPGKLTDEEFSIMQQHTLVGYHILKDMSDSAYFNRVDYFKTAMEITHYHHEKYDGSGYPEGLIGEQIPLSARIVAIADVFDALTSERPYKRAYSFEEALELIKAGSGQHFDPEIVAILLSKESQFKTLYEHMNQK